MRAFQGVSEQNVGNLLAFCKKQNFFQVHFTRTKEVDYKIVVLLSNGKYGFIREYNNDIGESQPGARYFEGCDSPCQIRVRAHSHYV